MGHGPRRVSVMALGQEFSVPNQEMLSTRAHSTSADQGPSHGGHAANKGARDQMSLHSKDSAANKGPWNQNVLAQRGHAANKGP